MDYVLHPRSEIDVRIRKLQSQMGDLTGVLLLQSVDMCYFSGTAQEGLVYIPRDSSALVMIRKSLPRAVQESPLEVMPLRSLRNLRAELGIPPGAEIGLELDVLPYNNYARLARGELVEPLQHCPEQAYLTVSERCIYDCKFCAVPKLQGGVKALSEVTKLVEQARETEHLKAISLTSGVAVSPEHEVARVARMVEELQRFGVPIGVSVCPAPGASRILRGAGAAEVKYNLETPDRDIFARVCPGISLQAIMEALAEAVNLFGRNRVYSNILVGLGESDSTLRESIDLLAEMGVMPILRAVYPHPLRMGETEMTRPSAERLLSLSHYLRHALDRHGLRGDLALTGCYRCTGCDLVPHRDL